MDSTDIAFLAASLTATDAELRTLRDIAREESKEDNAHAADADGGSALWASLFDNSASGAAHAMSACALAAELSAADLGTLPPSPWKAATSQLGVSALFLLSMHRQHQSNGLKTVGG